MASKYFIISVESRKGGVGKTTAALSLAKFLSYKYKYKVLYLDIDITGTNTAEAVKSSFWTNDFHPVTLGDKETNLLDIFNSYYLTGKGLPKWSREKKNGAFKLDDAKINMIGSQIYGENAKEFISPSILFDQLHAFWFVEFLQTICHGFMSQFRGNDIAIILDNSPGFVGFAPAIQDWLTDLGPLIGKFLIISSADIQDIIQCGYAIENIHNLLLQKIQIALMFNKMLGKKVPVSSVPKPKDFKTDFFLKLEENQATTNGGNLSYYYQPDQMQIETKNNKLTYDPLNYQGIIINKVHPDVKSGTLTLDTAKIFSHFKEDAPLRILMNPSKVNLASLCICHDDNVQYQFSSNLINYRDSVVNTWRKKRSKVYRMITDYSNQVAATRESGMSRKLIPDNFVFIEPEITKVIQEIDNQQDRLEEAVKTLKTAKLPNIVRLINSAWSPETIISDFTVVLNELQENLGTSMSSHPNEKTINSAIIDYGNRLDLILDRFISARELAKNENTNVKKIILSLKLLLLLSSGMEWLKNDNSFVTIFSAVATLQVLRFSNPRNTSSLSVPMFLAQERLNETEFSKSKLKEILKQGIDIIENQEDLMSKLYQESCYAQARLLDLIADNQFLLDVIDKLISAVINDKVILPYIDKGVRDVIVEKTLSHQEGYQKFTKEFTSLDRMCQFASVLEKPVKDWRVLS